MSCSNQESMQEYLIAKDEDPNFKSMSLATDVLVPNLKELDSAEQETLKKIKSINVALMLNDSVQNPAYVNETKRIEGIIKASKYQSLMRMNSEEQGMNLLYMGDDKVIDEVIFYGRSLEMGLVVARLNSRDLKSGDLIKIMQLADKMDLSQVEQFTSDL